MNIYEYVDTNYMTYITGAVKANITSVLPSDSLNRLDASLSNMSTLDAAIAALAHICSVFSLATSP